MDKSELETMARRGIEVSQLKSNKLLQEIFEKIKYGLDSRALNTPTTDTEACKDIIRTRQIMAGMEKAIESMINEGKFAEAELNRALKPQRQKIFSRL